MKFVRLESLRPMLGEHFVTADEVRSVFPEAGEIAEEFPFSAEEVRLAGKGGEKISEAAKLLEGVARGEMVLLPRIREVGGKPLTIALLIERFPQAFDNRFLEKVGYQLKEEWGILREPLAHSETPQPGWAIVTARPLPRTLNRNYDEQTNLLDEWASPWTQDGWSVRRRRAVEIVYDLIVYWAVRGQRLLERQWDWSSSHTVDRGILNVGGFGARGMQILSYSAAVRHGALGVCPTLSR